MDCSVDCGIFAVCGQEHLAIDVTYLNESRDDGLHCHGDDMEAVGVILLEQVGAHEGEDWHDVVQNVLLQARTVLYQCVHFEIVE